MKWSFGIVSVILTIIFSYMAIQNNKMAREITAREFGINQTTNKNVKVETKVAFDQEWEKSQNDFNGEWEKSRKDFKKKWSNF